jgi:hypothetical protein
MKWAVEGVPKLVQCARSQVEFASFYLLKFVILTVMGLSQQKKTDLAVCDQRALRRETWVPVPYQPLLPLQVRGKTALHSIKQLFTLGLFSPSLLLAKCVQV